MVAHTIRGLLSAAKTSLTANPLSQLASAVGWIAAADEDRRGLLGGGEGSSSCCVVHSYTYQPNASVSETIIHCYPHAPLLSPHTCAFVEKKSGDKRCACAGTRVTDGMFLTAAEELARQVVCIDYFYLLF